MITLSIVERHYKDDSIVAYTLKDVVGNVRTVNAKILKQKMQEGQVRLLGYKLTSNNRIVKVKEGEDEEVSYDAYERYLMKKSALGTNNSDFIIDGGVIKKYNGKSSVLTVPPLRIIGPRAFMRNCNIDKVTIPANVEKIGESAFEYSYLSNIEFKSDKDIEIADEAFCSTKLKSLVLPKGIKELPRMLCYECNELSDVSLGNSLVKIGYGAFEKTGLTSINLPDTLEVIDNCAFLGTKELKKVVIPDSVKIIKPGAFEDSGLEYAYVGANLTNLKGLTCAPDLKRIDVSPNNTVFVKKNGIIYNKEENAIVWRDRDADCTDLIIPTSITRISDYAFANCTFGNVKIPSTVKEIYLGAFLGAKMKNLECEAEHIANSAFKKAEMEDVKLINVGTVCGEAFTGAKMKTLLIQNARNINSNAFSIIEADKVLITVENMNMFAFYSAGIDKLYINTAYIRASTFELCRISQLVIGENVRVIGDSAFYKADKLRILTIQSKNIQDICRYAFARTALQEVKLNDTIERVGDGAFRDCKYLKKVCVGKNTNVHFDALRYSNNAELLRY